MVSRGNSRKHLGFAPNSINTRLSPCRRQETGSARFYHPRRLRFHFLVFLLTWSKASSMRQACLAYGGCTGKHFKGEQCEIRNWTAEHSPHAGWSSPSPCSVSCRIQTVPVLASFTPLPTFSPGTLPSLLSYPLPRQLSPGRVILPPCKITPASSLSLTTSPKPPSTGTAKPGSCPLLLNPLCSLKHPGKAMSL